MTSFNSVIDNRFVTFDAADAIAPNAADLVLREGDTGAAVRELQRLLNIKGAVLPIDGIFGAQTKNAVIRFQQANNLIADGVVGSFTWTALRRNTPAPIRLVDVCRYYDPAQFLHQTSAINWLEIQLSYRIRREFMQRWDAAPVIPDPMLQQGSVGTAVRRLQGLLNGAGFAIAIDGNFGPTTRAAVIQFQRQQGLVADGVVGDRTWDQLFLVVQPRPLRDVFFSYQEYGYDYMTVALEWLQNAIQPAVLTGFAQRWRNQIAVPVAETSAQC
jgi:peptidoglycan hydrolase-like protein with peptidoglycan-binding domain